MSVYLGGTVSVRLNCSWTGPLGDSRRRSWIRSNQWHRTLAVRQLNCTRREFAQLFRQNYRRSPITGPLTAVISQYWVKTRVGLYCNNESRLLSLLPRLLWTRRNAIAHKSCPVFKYITNMHILSFILYRLFILTTAGRQLVLRNYTESFISWSFKLTAFIYDTLRVVVSVAQLVARRTHDRKVVGSIPTNAVCFTVVR